MSLDPGPKPELAWLPVDRCTVDHRYQRTLESRRSQLLIDKLVERFRWSAFQAILAVKDDQSWVIIDGQHRCEAARRLGITHVPAVVVHAASIEEQARAFVQANLDRVAINPYALFHARLAAGDEAAVELQRLCKKCGITIVRYPIPADKMEAGQTLALGTLAKILAKRTTPLAVHIFSAVADAYRSVPGGLQAAFFAGADRVISEAEPTKRAEAARIISELLKTRTPGDFQREVSRHHEIHGGRLIDSVAGLMRARTTQRGIDPAANKRLAGGR